MIILPLVGFHFMKILGSAKQAKLTFVYYAHIGIMGLAEAMRIELDGKLAREDCHDEGEAPLLCAPRFRTLILHE